MGAANGRGTDIVKGRLIAGQRPRYDGRMRTAALLPFVAAVTLAALAVAQGPDREPGQDPGAPPPLARLTGVVLDSHSQPVPAALVTAEQDGAVVRQTRTDATGLFVLTNLPREGLVVRATTTGKAPLVGAQRLQAIDLRAGTVEIRTMPARRVTGVLRGPDGQPLAGAWVALSPTGFAALGALASATTTDERGAFGFELAACGPLALRAWARGCAGFAQTIPTGTEPVELECSMPDTTIVEHTFRLDDAAVARAHRFEFGVRAVAGGSEILMPEAAVTAAVENGRWLVRGWPRADSMQAALRSPTIATEPMWQEIVADSGDRTKTFYHQVGDSGFIRGKLRGEDGVALGGQQLAVRGWFKGQERRTYGTSAADGSFRLMAPVGDGDGFVIECLDDGYVLVDDSEPRGLRVAGLQHRSYLRRKHREGADHDLLLTRAATITATILTSSGEPFAGARVDIQLVPPNKMMRVLGRRRGGAMVEVSPWAIHRRADPRGDLRVAGIDLEANSEFGLQIGGHRGWAEVLVPVASDRVDVGEIHCEAGATLQGVVFSSTGWPAPGATVRVITFRGVERVHILHTDRAGRFTLTGLPPGTCDVALLTTDGDHRGQALKLPESGTATVELR